MEYKGKIEKYLKNLFGWNIKFEDFNEYGGKLPYLILASADYSIITTEGFKCIGIKPKNEDFRNNKNLVNSIEKKTGLPGLLILENLDTYQRKSLIQNKINFIVPDRQIYIPIIGTYMNERGLGKKQSDIEKLSPVATAIVITQLCKKAIEGKNQSDLADIMGYSKKTVSLAVNELEQHGLIKIKKDGRKKIIEFPFSSRELWGKVYTTAENIVEKKLYSSNDLIAAKIGVKASDSALSKISMLNSPNQETYAVYARDKRIKELELNPEVGTTTIEVWKINPSLSSSNGITDVFSLALSYRGDDDPRINKELNKLIEESL